jgi:hypothetical protein
MVFGARRRLVDSSGRATRIHGSWKRESDRIRSDAVRPAGVNVVDETSTACAEEV